MARESAKSRLINDFIRRSFNRTNEDGQPILSRRQLISLIKEKFDFDITVQGLAQREQRLNLLRDDKYEKNRSRPASPPPPPPRTLDEEVESDRKFKRLKEEHGSYKKRYEHLLTEHERLEREIEAARAIDAHNQVFPIEPKSTRGETEAVAIAVASDWHVEEVVKPHTVNGLNDYTPDIAKKRSIKFFQLIERMVKKERQDVKIGTLVLFLGGDFISGNIHESLLITCDMSPIHAAEYARELLESGIRFLLEHTDLDLVVPCSIGNHSRITKKVITGDEAGNALEWLIYGALARAFAGEKRVRFILSESYLNTVPILGLKVRFHHGHAVKFGGGVGGLTIPLNKAIFRWNQTEKVDLDVLGHFHQYTSMRQFVVNGSLIGTTDYGLRLGFEHEPPTQAFFLIDQRRGKTVSIPLFCGERT